MSGDAVFSQPKRLRHLIRCRLHLLWVWSDIKVQRGTGVGVAQNAGQGLGVHAAGEGMGGKGMP